MSEPPALDTVATFRRRMRAYFVRVVILLVAVPAALWVAFVAIPTAAGVLGVLALVGTVGGAYVVHWKTVRCPKCERWLVPLGMNGFAPRSCPHCKTQLR